MNKENEMNRDTTTSQLELAFAMSSKHNIRYYKSEKSRGLVDNADNLHPRPDLPNNQSRLGDISSNNGIIYTY